MESHKYELKNNRLLLIREAVVNDARAVLDYVQSVSGESDFLSFGPNEFELTEPEEEAFIGNVWPPTINSTYWASSTGRLWPR
ncbi:hypothetical protein ACFLXQ_01275 [Chloroflexota bacterium]